MARQSEMAGQGRKSGRRGGRCGAGNAAGRNRGASMGSGWRRLGGAIPSAGAPGAGGYGFMSSKEAAGRQEKMDSRSRSGRGQALRGNDWRAAG